MPNVSVLKASALQKALDAELKKVEGTDAKIDWWKTLDQTPSIKNIKQIEQLVISEEFHMCLHPDSYCKISDGKSLATFRCLTMPPYDRIVFCMHKMREDESKLSLDEIYYIVATGGAKVDRDNTVQKALNDIAKIAEDSGCKENTLFAAARFIHTLMQDEQIGKTAQIGFSFEIA